jgi:hypothetical protein
MRPFGGSEIDQCPHEARARDRLLYAFRLIGEIGGSLLRNHGGFARFRSVMLSSRIRPKVTRQLRPVLIHDLR